MGLLLRGVYVHVFLIKMGYCGGESMYMFILIEEIPLLDGTGVDHAPIFVCIHSIALLFC